MVFLEEIGKRIKMIRLYAGFKQKELAEKLNVQAPLLSLYEQGKRGPSLNFLKKFCDFFGISLSQFFVFVEDTNLKDKKTNEDLSLIIEDLNKTLNRLERINLVKNK